MSPTKGPPVSARSWLVADRDVRVRGSGRRIVLMDEPMLDPPTWDGRLQIHGERGPTSGDHAFRGASIAAGSDEAGGVAPEAQVVAVPYAEVFPSGYAEALAELVEQEGSLDVCGHAYSARESASLRLEGRAAINRLVDDPAGPGVLMVAAAGHDGERGVRWPATAESVLAVGVCDQDGRPHPRCSVDPEARKPELLVEDLSFSAQHEDGRPGTMDGTSAAVNVVSGLAALWTQRLVEGGVEPRPVLLRAVLLAASEPIEGQSYRRVSGRGLDAAELPVLLRADEPRATVTVSTRPGRVATLAVVARRAPSAGIWVEPDPVVHVTVSTGGSTRQERQRGWLTLELPESTQPCTVTIVVEGRAAGVAACVLDATPAPSPTDSRAPVVRRFAEGPVVVGLSASHDASACVMVGGRIEAAIALERITRIKHDGVGTLNTRQAVDYCLATAGLRPEDVDLFAFNLQPVLPGYVGLSQPSASDEFDLFEPFGERALYVSHHLCHAFAAYHGSSFEQEAAVLVADGSGGSTVGEPDLMLRGPQFRRYLDGTSPQRPGVHVVSMYRFEPSGYRFVEREEALSFNTRCGSSSLGETYAAVSRYVFGSWHDSGKLMGLAPYGDADALGPSLLLEDEHGRLCFSAAWKDRYRRTPGSGDPMDYRHLAARVQRDLERALAQRVERIIERTGLRRLAYSGGIALNSVTNEKLLRHTALEELFVFPASNDTGICVGAAAAGHFELTGATRGIAPRSDFHGHPYSDEDCRLAIERYAPLLRWRDYDPADVTERLEHGQVLGLFEGGAELGPRALGHRSIIADPRQRETWRYINRRIKFREDFRPFAPAVVAERAHEFFDVTGEAPYMLRVVPVKPEHREALGAVTHVDGSARVQTVRADVAPRFHELLSGFGARTGYPVLINTSMNVRGEPIVETPSQALELLLATHLDAMILGPYVVELAPAQTLRRDSRLVLAPKARVTADASGGQPRYRLISDARRTDYALESWAFFVLARADGDVALGTLLDAAPEGIDEREALEVLDAFVQLRLVYEVQESTARPEHDASSTDESAEVWRGLASWIEPADRALPPGPGWRSRAPEHTLRLVEPHRSRLGITRIADVTHYDRVGIPVFCATRPAVDGAQITATQGKGSTRLDARLSALMEAVERNAAARARPSVVSTLPDLRDAGRAVLGPAQLGGTDPGERVLEWVAGRSLRTGQEVLVPAAAVLFPYSPPSSVHRGLRPSTTGLAAGNTRAEAIVQALSELVERDAVSRYRVGELEAPLLDLTALPSSLASLIERFEQQEVRLFVAELGLDAALPTYFVATWTDDGSTPPVALAGQGTSASPQLALRRALHEAAQCRVVAIQGSREDLVRHAAQWHGSWKDGASSFASARERSARCGVERLPAEPEDIETVERRLQYTLGRLEQRGHHEAVVVDLSDPQIELPVVAVVVPGLLDTVVEPGLRRRSHD